jgi:hypothetical protein
VAGSAVLQNPQVNNEGNIICSAGSLYNCSGVFGPDGRLAGPLVKKVFPITDELGFTSCGKADAMPVFNTPAGAMGLLVCADSWYPQAYAALSGKCDFLVVPSLAGTEAFWQSPWKGYNGGPAPQDVNSADIGRLTEGQAWARYSMGSRAPAAGIHQGINVFFTGTMWDMTPEGRVLVLKHDSLNILPPAINHGRIVNLVLEKD